MKISPMCVQIIWDMLNHKKRTLTKDDILFGVQIMCSRSKPATDIGVPELTRITGLSKYKVQQALKAAGLAPVIIRKVPGGTQPFYDRFDALQALGYEKVEVEGENETV